MAAPRRRDRHPLSVRPGRTPALTAGTFAAALAACCALAGCGRAGNAAGPIGTPQAASALPSPTLTVTPPAATPTSGPATPTSPAAGPAPSTGASAGGPGFGWKVGRVTAAQLGASWHQGCPVGPSSLRSVRLTYWDLAGRRRTGELILHAGVVADTRAVFATLYRLRFPIRSIRPVSEFGADDDASMAADNTSAFNCRLAVAAGPPAWSRHAYGRAIDINPVENPYLFAGRVLPPAGKRYADRSRPRPGMIRRGDAVYRAFRSAGYRWGGSFRNPDYQHFDR